MNVLKKNSLTVMALIASLLSVQTLHADDQKTSDASPVTQQFNAQVLNSLPFANREDFDLATRGFIARPPSVVIKDAQGKVVWDMDQYAYQTLDRDAPDTVNPSLWRQAVLNSQIGLFQVAEGIYQVRGYDLSNISFVETDNGYIVIDPLITQEVAKAALELLYQHRPKKPVVAVIYSHSHADHFGGVRGVVNEEDVQSGKVRILASEGFMDHAVSENVLAGNVMSRRAAYMFGSLLPKDEKGDVGSGLGKGISGGLITLIPPTDIIQETGETMTIDGVEMVFQNVPGAEAPAEMMVYFPRFKAFYAAEEANANLHNLYTLRGAQVRDALKWSGYLYEAIEFISGDVEVLFGGHHWPRWGKDSIVNYLARQGDAYKYIHDQTLRLANHGLTPIEIAEQIEFPDAIGHEWFNRGYYGSLNHNVKAVYQLYLGWFDGNPANLHPLPPAQSGAKYVEFMGGADAVIQQAKKSYDKGEYRWVAQVLNHVIFAEPDNQAARDLQASALEQMGFQAESGPWRNFFLTGAQELRQGIVKAATPTTVSPDMVGALTVSQFFDYVAIRLNGPKAASSDIKLNFVFKDSGDKYRVHIRNGVLHYTPDKQHEKADATVNLSRRAFAGLLLAGKPLSALIEAGLVAVEGNQQKLEAMIALLDTFDFWFEIARP